MDLVEDNGDRPSDRLKIHGADPALGFVILNHPALEGFAYGLPFVLARDALTKHIVHDFLKLPSQARCWHDPYLTSGLVAVQRVSRHLRLRWSTEVALPDGTSYKGRASVGTARGSRRLQYLTEIVGWI